MLDISLLVLALLPLPPTTAASRGASLPSPPFSRPSATAVAFVPPTGDDTPEDEHKAHGVALSRRPRSTAPLPHSLPRPRGKVNPHRPLASTSPEPSLAASSPTSPQQYPFAGVGDDGGARLRVWRVLRARGLSDVRVAPGGAVTAPRRVMSPAKMMGGWLGCTTMSTVNSQSGFLELSLEAAIFSLDPLAPLSGMGKHPRISGQTDRQTEHLKA